MHICVNKLGHPWFKLWPVVDSLSTGCLGTNFSEIFIKKTHLKTVIWNRCTFCLDLNVLMKKTGTFG